MTPAAKPFPDGVFNENKIENLEKITPARRRAG
jgi:hypothetical protein